MTIHELLALTGLTGSDEIPVWDEEASGEPTKKITAQNFAAAIKTLASLLGTGDVVNNLTSTATDKPLSAAQGKTLNEAITQSTADTGWLDLVTGIKYRVKRGILFVCFNIAVQLSTTFTNIAILPQGFRPTINSYFRCTGSNGFGDVTVMIDSNGLIMARVDSDTATAINGIVSTI